MYSSEVHEGETEDIWANEVYLNSLLQEQHQLKVLMEAAQARKIVSGNFITGLLATMSVKTRTREYELHTARIDAAQLLTQPSYRAE